MLIRIEFKNWNFVKLYSYAKSAALCNNFIIIYYYNHSYEIIQFST